MTLTKQSTNYRISDTYNDNDVRGDVAKFEDGTININISIDAINSYASFTKNPDGNVHTNSGYHITNDITDYMQTIVASILAELDSVQE